MNVLYYSNYCKHSERILQFIVKSDLTKKISAICIDKRKKDPRTGQYVIVLENGKSVTLPPNVHSVPSLLIHPHYNVISGDEIMRYYQPVVEEMQQKAVGDLGEPAGYEIYGNGSISDQYTNFMDGGNQNKTNFVGADHYVEPIRADPENYRPNKLSPDVTIDKLHSYRMEEMQKLTDDDMNNMITQLTETREKEKLNIESKYGMAPKPIYNI
jgi:hypothetical protein